MADENKFAPPPSNIVIRTMEKDIEALKTGGGELPPPPPIPETPIVPPIDATPFLDQTLYQSTVSEPPVSPPPPVETVHAASPMPQPKGVEKKILTKPLILALAGVAVIIAFGAIGYFVIFPMVKNAFLPTEPSPTPVAALTPSLIETPAPPPPPGLPTNPLLQIANPATRTAEVTIGAKTAEELQIAIINETRTEEATGTFKVITVRVGDVGLYGYLSSKEMFQLLFSSAPTEVIETLDETYAVYIFWARPDNAILGAMFSVKPEAVATLGPVLKAWEATLATDASPFFLGKPVGTLGAFSDGMFSGVPLRFANFDSGFAIDYALTQNVLIFTTHKDSMFEAIRRLQGI